MNKKHDIHSVNMDQLMDEHRVFMDRCGVSSTKLDADQYLEGTIILSRIKYVLGVMKQIGAIDVVLSEDEDGDGILPQLFQIRKRGYHTTISVLTDGKKAVLFHDAPTTDRLGVVHPEQKVYAVNDPDFDWNEFSKQVLEYIHNTIYHSREANLLNMFGSS